ncbi:MAG: carbonic anhydrase [Promethearchaeota archaeon]
MTGKIVKLPEDISWEKLQADFLERNRRWMKKKSGTDKVNGALRTIVLACLDSRIAVDLIFDAVPGEILVMKNAGNEISEDVWRSLLLATYGIGARHIIILGHTHCGTAIRDNESKVEGVKKNIGEETLTKLKDYSGKDLADFLGLFNSGDDGIVKNVHGQCAILQKKFDELIPKKDHPNIVPAMYDIETGELTFS